MHRDLDLYYAERDEDRAQAAAEAEGDLDAERDFEAERAAYLNGGDQ